MHVSSSGACILVYCLGSQGVWSLDILGGVQKRVDAPHQRKSQKMFLRLGALTRVTSKPNLKINAVVSKTVVRGLLGTQATPTI